MEGLNAALIYEQPLRAAEVQELQLDPTQFPLAKRQKALVHFEFPSVSSGTLMVGVQNLQNLRIYIIVVFIYD